MMKLAWMIDSEPKNLLDRREWPVALWAGPAMKQAALLICESRFTNYAMQSGNHLPITVVIFRYLPSGQARKILYTQGTFRSVKDAIEFVEHFLPQRPDWHPTII